MTTMTLRESYRAHLRQRALEAAYAEAVEKGWAKVRVAQVANQVGVSRAMIYKEFGDKQGLGEALVLHEGERFLIGINKVLETYPHDAAGGIRASVLYTLAEAEKSPLLRAVLVSHPDPTLAPEAQDEPTGMLPLITTSKRLLDLATDTLATWLRDQLPRVDGAEVRDATDALVRLTVSHLATPGDDADTTGRRICEVALRYLGFHDSSTEKF